MCDSKGVIYKGRKNLDQFKSAHAVDTQKENEDVIKNADVFLGLSAKDVVTKEMATTGKILLFCLCKSDPEIKPELIQEVDQMPL